MEARGQDRLLEDIPKSTTFITVCKMAVGMREAPGEPSAIRPPSSEETTVGLMLETRRSPGSRA